MTWSEYFEVKRYDWKKKDESYHFFEVLEEGYDQGYKKKILTFKIKSR